MGADLILAATQVPKDAEEAIRRIDRLNSEEIEYIRDYGGLWDFTDEEVREALNSAASDILAGPEYRDLAVMTFGGKEYFISGGMSWGDDPTDSFRPVMLLELSGITNDEDWEERG